MKRFGNIKRMLKNSNRRPLRFKIVCFCAVLLSGLSLSAQSTRETSYWGIRLSGNASTNPAVINRYGIPFIQKTLPVQHNRPACVEVGGTAKRIFLFGMTDTSLAHSWTNLRE